MKNRDIMYFHQKRSFLQKVRGFGRSPRTSYFLHIKTMAILFLLLLLTGCSEVVEIQDRDFVLALGASWKDGQYELTYVLPDLGALAKGGKTSEEGGSGQFRTYRSASLLEIEQLYNRSSNKRLDYRHLEALILDGALSSSDEKLPEFLGYVENNYEISRNVRVFYYGGDIQKLLDDKGKIGGNIGEYLKKLEKNYQGNNGLPLVGIGGLINSFTQKQGIVIPLLEVKEEQMRVNGAAIFQDAIFAKTLTEEELDIYYIIKGQGKEFTFHTQDGLTFKMKNIKSKMRYEMRDNKPLVKLSVTGTADTQQNSQEERPINKYLKDAITGQLNASLETGEHDYFNLYDKSSIKNREIWLAYQNRRTDFVRDVEIDLEVDIDERPANH